MNIESLKIIAESAAVLGVLGVIFGAVLGVAAKVFAIERDPREDEIVSALPGANCGACGYAGCGGYASAVVSGDAPANKCVPGGNDAAAAVAAIMGLEAGTVERQVAFVRCAGGATSERKYNYIGLEDCYSALRAIGEGPLSCRWGCLGLGTCAKACEYGALSVAEGVAKVNREKCKGCKKCVLECPKRLISIVPYDAPVTIGCNSRAKGASVKKLCEVGCIACGLCVKNCPNGALTLEDNIVNIDYSKCVACGTCVEKCPRKVIHAR